MLARRFTIVVLIAALFGMLFASLVAGPARHARAERATPFFGLLVEPATR